MSVPIEMIADRETAMEPVLDQSLCARTVWGLSPTQLHDRYWASLGVQVIRQDEQCQLDSRADVFMLTEPRLLTFFDLQRPTDSELICLRLRNSHDQAYRERLIAGPDGSFIAFRRDYRGERSTAARVFVTRDKELARTWQQAGASRQQWRRLIKASKRRVESAPAAVFDSQDEQQTTDFVRRLVRDWKDAATAIPRALRQFSSAWCDPESSIDNTVQFVGPAWIGAGRSIGSGCTVIGPAVLWDDPTRRPLTDALALNPIKAAIHTVPPIPAKGKKSRSVSGKRAFDVVAAIIGLLITLPFYPFILLAIWLDDGRPFFYAHRRETCGGREFPCFKFRSMKRGITAERVEPLNQVDGPHFHSEDDPRLTRVGRFLRRTNVDELPQLINVLRGEMSIVGPRPSPYEENQFCPAWRQARLSVRPGITGLWQVARTRQKGLDFQEWIKFDIEYVEQANWKLDLSIIRRTIFKGKGR